MVSIGSDPKLREYEEVVENQQKTIASLANAVEQYKQLYEFAKGGDYRLGQENVY